eukprot:g2091.t1
MARSKTPVALSKVTDSSIKQHATVQATQDIEYSYVVIQAIVCRSVALCYFIAFASLYVQYDGLFGVDGLEPAHVHLKRISDGGSMSNLLPFHNVVGVDVDTMADLVMLVGMFSSFFAFIGPNNIITMFLSWLCYLSLYKIGQTFLSFQWDILLMEVGILAVFFAPSTTFGTNLVPLAGKTERPSNVIRYMLRFTLFKLMFMSGIVKIQANCPSWLQLRALEYHYATQCIPTPLAWYFHQLPPAIHQFSVAVCLLIEIPFALLILSPFRFLRLFAGYCQIFLQFLILLTGNYNFFNFLTIILSISCFDDQHFTTNKYDESEIKEKEDNDRNLFSLSKVDRLGMFAWFSKSLSAMDNAKYSNFLFTAVIIATTYFTGKAMFSVTKYDDTNVLNAYYFEYTLTVNETNKLVNDWLPQVLQVYSIWMLLVCINSVHQSFMNAVSSARKNWPQLFRSGIKLVHTVAIVTAILLVILPSSIVTFVSISDRMRSLMPKYAYNIYQRSHPYMVSSSYGLFRTMTGMGKPRKDSLGRVISVVKRPEIIIEGSYDGNSWSEIHFKYKPGKLDQAPPFVAPHQPRLDWQMWFAALANYPPWYIHLVDKLLEGSKNVIGLLNGKTYPFTNKPPKFIRSKLYHYDLTRYDYSWHRNFGTATTLINSGRNNTHLWWHRSKKFKEYTPVLEKSNPSVNSFLNQNGWDRPTAKEKDILKRCENIKHIKKHW